MNVKVASGRIFGAKIFHLGQSEQPKAARRQIIEIDLFADIK